MADIHGSPGDAPQMPQAGAGPAPVPYTGSDYSPAVYDTGAADLGNSPGPDVMAGVSGAMGVQESGYAHDVNAGLVTPYYAGGISPIGVHGDADAGGRDTVSGTVAGAVAAAEARFAEYEAYTHSQGGGYGDLMALPQNSMDPAVGVQGAEGAYYDPPRDY